MLGGLIEGFPLLESGTVVGGFEFGRPVLLPLFLDAPELLCPELPVVAELLRLPVAELSLAPEPLPELFPLVEAELFRLSLWGE